MNFWTAYTDFFPPLSAVFFTLLSQIYATFVPYCYILSYILTIIYLNFLFIIFEPLIKITNSSYFFIPKHIPIVCVTENFQSKNLISLHYLSNFQCSYTWLWWYNKRYKLWVLMTISHNFILEERPISPPTFVRKPDHPKWLSAVCYTQRIIYFYLFNVYIVLCILPWICSNVLYYETVLYISFIENKHKTEITTNHLTFSCNCK